ncbi:membrane protein [Streptomyces phage Enygma]
MSWWAIVLITLGSVGLAGFGLFIWAMIRVAKSPGNWGL